MLDSKKTVSDMLIKEFKKKGYGIDAKLPSKVCAEVALKHSEKLGDEIRKTKELIKNLEL